MSIEILQDANCGYNFDPKFDNMEMEIIRVSKEIRNEVSNNSFPIMKALHESTPICSDVIKMIVDYNLNHCETCTTTIPDYANWCVNCWLKVLPNAQVSRMHRGAQYF